MNSQNKHGDPASFAGSSVPSGEAHKSGGTTRLMKPTSRLIVAAAALLLALTYYFPLWEISLDAPQYPEGLGLEIWINQMDGQHPGDLKKINNLNHYIGMKKIKPESIPELGIMPWIMRGLMMFGLLAALVGRRSLLLLWLLLFLTMSVAGLVDFYLWGYDYGHNLDTENAIIKVPGMSYQPPLIGTKTLLNFKAISFPGLGGWAAIVAILFGALTWLYEFRRARKYRISILSTSLSACLLAMFCLSLGCARPGPAPIQYGIDQCDYCKMTIADQNFGSELVTAKGKVYKYDSIECLAAADRRMDKAAGTVHSRWVTNFSHPGAFLELPKAIIVATERQKSPMGVGLVAVASQSEADALIQSVGGSVLDWPRVKSLVAETWKLEGKE